jgi:hypothetical protein
MLRETIQYAGANNLPGQGVISKQEADEIYDIAKTLGMSVPQITEYINMYLPGTVTAGKVAEGINWVDPTTGGQYISQFGGTYDPDKKYAAGGGVGAGIGTLPQSQGYYLGGATDGMADKVPARINGNQEAALSDGEFVVDAGTVSALGNGNSAAGAKALYDMMARVRQAAHGKKTQQNQINPRKVLPA